MDNHPIPQDVTGFQFKLIGAMTLKQFGYVACGVIAAVILYYLPLQGFFGVMAKIIFIPILGGSGIAVAFLPIEGRPVDVMVSNLIKALVSPNQYLYHKNAKAFAFPSAPKQVAKTHPSLVGPQKALDKERKLQALLQSIHNAPPTTLDVKESAFLQNFAPQTVVQSPPPPQPTVQMPQLQPVQQVTPPPPPQAPPAPVQMRAAPPPAPIQTPPLTSSNQRISPVAAPQTSTTVRNITKEMGAKVGLPHVSDTPNVIVGIVKDPRGNVLPNMLVEVKDKDGNPVRAFKTNPLGQFASATPLATGVYTIELEDPKKQHTFDIIQISANNQIILPIEIFSHDAREALRKELFN
jgi:hypothetical protein